MSLTLEQVLLSARDQHPLFHRSRVPHGVLARFLSDFQNTLIGAALKSDPFYCAQSVTIALATGSSNAVGTAGPGTEGGVPATLDGATIATVQQATGALVTVDSDAENGDAVRLYGPKAVTSATTTTLTYTGAGRTVNGDAGKVVVITAGVGYGQRREIASNTADTWTVSEDWTTTPTTGSLFEIVNVAEEVDESAGVVTSLPATVERQGFLVKLTAAGIPYIDYSAPVTASVETGVPLPSMTALLGGTCYDADGEPGPLYVTTFRDRFQPARFPAVYAYGQEVRFCGETGDWDDVQSVELHYAPLAPSLTALTDYLLVPDAAKPCLVARCAAFMAQRLQGQADVPVDAGFFVARAEQAERDYLQTVRLSGRAQTRVMRGMD